MLLANLEASRPVNKLNDQCKVRRILLSLDPDDQQILKDAIASPTWNINQLVLALKDRGISMSYNTLRRHEQKLCQCGAEFYA